MVSGRHISPAPIIGAEPRLAIPATIPAGLPSLWQTTQPRKTAVATAKEHRRHAANEEQISEARSSPPGDAPHKQKISRAEKVGHVGIVTPGG